MKKLFLTLLLLFIPNFVLANEVVNVVFAIDNNFVIPTMIAVDSIFKSNKSNSKYNIYVLEYGLTKHSKNFMTNYIEKYDNNVNFISIDNKDISDWKSLNVIAPIIIARLNIPELLPKEMDKVIYLDADILVTEDLSKLYNTNLGDKSIGMVSNVSGQDVVNKFAPFGFSFKHGYYNAGIMLMDLKKCRDFEFSRMIFEAMEANSQMYQKVVFADQNVISEVVGSKVMELNSRWNNQCYMYSCITNFDEKNGGIYHYLGEKPWDKLLFDDLISEELLYIDYWKNSEFKNYIYYYLWKLVRKTHKTNISFENIKSKYVRYFEVLKKNKTFPKYLIADLGYILNN